MNKEYQNHCQSRDTSEKPTTLLFRNMNVNGNSTDSNESKEVDETTNLFASLKPPPEKTYLSFADNGELRSFALYRESCYLATFDRQQHKWNSNKLDIIDSVKMGDGSRSNTFDAMNKQIWSCGLPGSSHLRSQFLSFRLETGDVVLHSFHRYQRVPQIGRPFVLSVGNNLHIVGSDSRDFVHMIVNKNTMSCKYQVSDQAEMETIGYRVRYDGLVHIESTDNLYLFAHLSPEDDQQDVEWNMVFRYSKALEKWQRVTAKEPRLSEGIRFDCSCYVTLDISNEEQYIIVFGQPEIVEDKDEPGYWLRDYTEISRNVIEVYDIQANALRNCSIQLPSNISYSQEFHYSVNYDAVVIRGQREEKLSVFGYIRRLYDTKEFKELAAMPVHIMELISEWICINYVHLVPRGDGSHFRIAVNDILQSLD